MTARRARIRSPPRRLDSEGPPTADDDARDGGGGADRRARRAPPVVPVPPPAPRRRRRGRGSRGVGRASRAGSPIAPLTGAPGGASAWAANTTASLPVGGAGGLGGGTGTTGGVGGRGDPHRHPRRGHRRPRWAGPRSRGGGRGPDPGPPGRHRGRVGPRPSTPGCCPPTRCPAGSRRPRTLRLGRAVVGEPNWALAEPIPWRAKALSEAGTVHLGADSAWCGGRPGYRDRDPPRIAQLVGQMTTTDPHPSPPRAPEASWSYTHLPAVWTKTATQSPSAPRSLSRRHAPPASATASCTASSNARDLQDADANLVHGARGGGGGGHCSNSWCSRPVGARAGPGRRSRPLPRQRGRACQRRRARRLQFIHPRAQRWASTAGAAAAQARRVRGGARPRPRTAHGLRWQDCEGRRRVGRTA